MVMLAARAEADRARAMMRTMAREHTLLKCFIWKTPFSFTGIMRVHKGSAGFAVDGILQIPSGSSLLLR